MDGIVSGEVLGQFVAAARRVARQGLVQCGSGNLSQRLDSQHMLITTTGSWLEEITAGQVALCRIKDGACLNGKQPSMELGFHRGILAERPEVNAVLHFQSPAATALACRRGQPESFFVIPEVAFYIGPVAVVPYLPPGSDGLAAAVTAALRQHDAALLQNHGQVAAGKDLLDAFRKAVYFELAAEICLRAGEGLQCLGAAEVAALYRQAHSQPGQGV